MANMYEKGKQVQMIFNDNIRWIAINDGDSRGYALMQRHYTFQAYKDNRRQCLSYRNRHLFVGPGEKMVLITPDNLALFVWRKFIDKSGQQGINCAVFRNEGPHLSSELITEAELLAANRWPGERAYTYVNAQKIQSSNPGCCFQKAGWRKLPEVTQRKGLVILETFLPTRNSINPTILPT